MTFNLAEGWQEVAVQREGITWLTDRTIYGTIASGENVPVHRETVTRTTLSRGGCMYETSVTFLSNHQVERGHGHDRSAAKDRKANLRISPNPANDAVLIQFPPAADQQVQVQIIGLLGARVRQFGDLMPVEGDLRLDIKDLPVGLYWLQITSPGHSVTSRFVKN